MDDTRKQTLLSFTAAAKAVLYNAQRMEGLLPMLDSPESAQQAVQTVMGAIEQKKLIPPDMAPLLAMNVYLLLVDMAQRVTGEKPDPNIVKAVIGQLMGGTASAYRKPAQPAQPPQAPQGVVQKAMA